jgi:hypothetical protein
VAVTHGGDPTDRPASGVGGQVNLARHAAAGAPE